MPTDASVDVILPAQFAVSGRVHRNPILQLSHPSLIEPVHVTDVMVRRTSALELRRGDGSSVVIVQKRVQPVAGMPELLHVPEQRGMLEGLDDHVAISTWITPAPAPQPSSGQRGTVLASWTSFQFREEERSGDTVVETGLRPPQIGALFGILAHWKASTLPATVVMPTGTGKTETMLALLVREKLERLLVIVPTGALRDQVGRKFVELGLLRKLGIIGADAVNPVVCFLEHKPRNPAEVDEIFTQCNVVVTTMAVAGQCTEAVQKRMAELCSNLFIDEAHHISARTWEAFRKQFLHRNIVQFTATPFRNDGKLVDGRVVFNYPLKKAQAEGYFKAIRFRPVDELDRAESDLAIATAAIEQLRGDIAAGYPHLLMARCDDIKRAQQVHATYLSIAPDLEPIIVHNEIAAGDARVALRRLRATEVRVVVCVDMLGEGFDLPELKIAAIHDIHKSLAITLQFTGRFTRTRMDLGDATVIANIADPRVGDALQDLYAEDADWNVLLRNLSENANAREGRRSEFLDAFRDVPETVSLRTIFPKMSAVVYRTTTTRWYPERALEAMGNTEVHAGPTVNDRDKVVLFVTREHEAVSWGDVRDVRNTEWHLYLVHWDEERGLLFINSSNNSSLHEDLAKAVAGEDVVLIRGETVFRSLHDVNRLVLTNLGLSDLINDHLRFSLHVGSDISDVLPDALRMNKRKSNLFARGYENGAQVTVGCSQKGRVWSMATATDLSSWVDWCHAVGTKLIDDTISTADVFRNVILPKTVKARPALVPLLIEWPESFLEKTEDAISVQIGESQALFFDVELQVSAFSADGPIGFNVVMPDAVAHYEVRFATNGVHYDAVGGREAYIQIGRRRRPLSDWFRQEHPAIRFENGAYLEGDEFFELPSGANRLPFDVSRIEAWAWAGVDIRKESQNREKRGDSIQRHVLNRLTGPDHEFDIVFDDDGSGEAADIVCLRVNEERLEVHLYHCKFSGAPLAGARVDDLYAVCGQAQRSVHWRSDVPELLKHLRHREETRRRSAIKSGIDHVSRFERGDLQVLGDIRKRSSLLRPDFRIHIVQPGLSKATANRGQLELLAATESYLIETSAIPMGVIASA